MSNILLGVTGSVAAVKTAELARALSAWGEVQLAATGTAEFFLRHQEIEPQFKLHRDADEWRDDYVLGHPVLHIELRRWADLLVLAPLDANTLAKLHHGLCDNLLTCVYRAWDWSRPVVAAPAMNTLMWENAPTAEQIAGLRARGVRIVDPETKRLACDDVGIGAMAEIARIVRAACEALGTGRGADL